MVDVIKNSCPNRDDRSRERLQKLAALAKNSSHPGERAAARTLLHNMLSRLSDTDKQHADNVCANAHVNANAHYNANYQYRDGRGSVPECGDDSVNSSRYEKLSVGRRYVNVQSSKRKGGIEHAKDLITSTHLPMEEISSITGLSRLVVRQLANECAVV